MMSHYETLRISRTASLKEIKLAYRKLISQFHPDRGGNGADDVSMCAKLNEAYAVLSDPGKKEKYDSSLRAYGQLKSKSLSIFRSEHPGVRVYKNVQKMQ